MEHQYNTLSPLLRELPQVSQSSHARTEQYKNISSFLEPYIQHTANTDYSPTASPSSGTISASNTQSTHTFMSLNDNNSEAPETFFVDIMISGTTPSSLSATADPDRATVRIIDNDGKLHYVYYCTCPHWMYAYLALL